MKGKLSYWGRKSQENTKTRKTLVGIHYLGPNIEKHKNTQNTNNTFGHSRTYNEPHMFLSSINPFAIPSNPQPIYRSLSATIKEGWSQLFPEWYKILSKPYCWLLFHSLPVCFQRPSNRHRSWTAKVEEFEAGANLKNWSDPIVEHGMAPKQRARNEDRRS